MNVNDILRIPTISRNQLGKPNFLNSFLILSYLTTQTKKTATAATIFNASIRISIFNGISITRLIRL